METGTDYMCPVKMLWSPHQIAVGFPEHHTERRFLAELVTFGKILPTNI